MVNRKLSGFLERALGGDPTAVAYLARVDQASLQEAHVSRGKALVVTRAATVAILRGLLDDRFAPTEVQSWASLMRRGYVADSGQIGPIRPLEIEFEEAWEDGISAAVSRLDEIGDVVDGEVTRGEVLDLLQFLGES